MKIPTREEFHSIIVEAEKARIKVAEETYEKLPPLVKNFPDMARACGGARLILLIDGRTAMGRFINSLMKDPLPNVSVVKTREGFELYIGKPIGYQQEVVNVAAEKAALKVIEERLEIKGVVASYLS